MRNCWRETSLQALRPYFEEGDVSATDAHALALALHRVDEDMSLSREPSMVNVLGRLTTISEAGAFRIKRVAADAGSA